jgi:hypothetical protein
VRLDGPQGTGAVGEIVVRTTTVAAALPPDLVTGTYTVTWRVTSVDGHPISGALRFTLTLPAEASMSASDATPAATSAASSAAASDGTSPSGSPAASPSGSGGPHRGDAAGRRCLRPGGRCPGGDHGRGRGPVVVALALAGVRLRCCHATSRPAPNPGPGPVGGHPHDGAVTADGLQP